MEKTGLEKLYKYQPESFNYGFGHARDGWIYFAKRN